MNRYPLWKYILIVIIVTVGTVLALPNLYGKDPALQISSLRSAEVNELTQLQVETALEEAGINATDIHLDLDSLIVRFNNTNTQLKAQTIVQESLGKAYVVALNLAPATPDWLRTFGAEPMFLGLDLRGGVHFLMEVDMPAAVAKAYERYVSDLRTLLRDNKVRYKTIIRKSEGGVLIRFRDAQQILDGTDLIEENYPELKLSQPTDVEGEHQLLALMSESTIQETRRFALQQNITTLRKRVNELGVAEPVIQQQGLSRVVVQLPGVQDTARAKEILGATATLEFRMLDEEHSVQDALDGRTPAGSKLYYDRQGQPVLLRKQVMLTGDYIIDAASGIDPLGGGPDVTITLDGKGAKLFSKRTRDEVGKRMSVIFIENKTESIEKILADKNINIVKYEPEIIITNGGDGTFLLSESKYQEVPKLILRSNSICKLCVDCSTEGALEKISKGRYRIEETSKIDVIFNDKILTATNEIVVHNGDPRHAIRYDLEIEKYAIRKENIIGDGIVVSTILGSTGYYRSITDSIFYTGIGLAFNNSTETFDHMVLDEDSKIKVKIRRGPVKIFADNQEEIMEINEGDEILIKKSEVKTRLIKV